MIHNATALVEELRDFLSDLYSLELQAKAQLKRAPDMAGESTLTENYKTHYIETERQLDRLGARLEALGISPSALKNSVMKLGGKGFLLFAKLQSETPGRLHVHSYAFEAMESAGYTILARLAEMAGDPATGEVARSNRDEENAMLKRLERDFDLAEELAHGETPRDELPQHLVGHLAELHALSSQSYKLLEQGADEAESTVLVEAYTSAADRTHAYLRAMEQRLEALESGRSVVQDAAMKLGGLNWSLFFRSQSDTPIKLAGFAYAVEHLIIAAAELLARTASRVGDAVTEDLARSFIATKRHSAEQIAGSFDVALDETLALKAV